MERRTQLGSELFQCADAQNVTGQGRRLCQYGQALVLHDLASDDEKEWKPVPVGDFERHPRELISCPRIFLKLRFYVEFSKVELDAEINAAHPIVQAASGNEFRRETMGVLVLEVRPILAG